MAQDEDHTAETVPAEDPRWAGIRRDQKRLLQRATAVRTAVARPEENDLGGLSDHEMARELAYDTIEALVRAEIVLQEASAALLEQTVQLQEFNRLKLIELQKLERQLSLAERIEIREQERIDGVVAFAGKRFDSLFGWIGTIAKDPRVTGAIITAIVVLLSLATGWVISHPVPPTQFQVPAPSTIGSEVPSP